MAASPGLRRGHLGGSADRNSSALPDLRVGCRGGRMRKLRIDRALAGAILQAFGSISSHAGALDHRLRGGGEGVQFWYWQGVCALVSSCACSSESAAALLRRTGIDWLRCVCFCRRPSNRRTTRVEDLERGGELVNVLALSIMRAVLARVDTTQILGEVGDNARCMMNLDIVGLPKMKLMILLYLCLVRRLGCWLRSTAFVLDNGERTPCQKNLET